MHLKRWGWTIAVIALAALLCAPLAVAADDGPAAQGCTTAGDMYVTAYLGLRLRSTPSLASQQVGILWNGEHVKVIGCDVRADGILWSNVEVSRFGTTLTGWASATYLTTGGVNTPGPASCEVATAALRLRAAPSLSGAILRIVPRGTTLLTTSTPETMADGYAWKNMTISGTSVWAAKTYLQCTD